MKLRVSQIETLLAVARFERGSVYQHQRGASPAKIAPALGRDLNSVETSLLRLKGIGLVKAVSHPLISDVYRLTSKGRAALEEGTQ